MVFEISVDERTLFQIVTSSIVPWKGSLVVADQALFEIAQSVPVVVGVAANVPVVFKTPFT
jgi:hypothetical protein